MMVSDSMMDRAEGIVATVGDLFRDRPERRRQLVVEIAEALTRELRNGIKFCEKRTREDPAIGHSDAALGGRIFEHGVSKLTEEDAARLKRAADEWQGKMTLRGFNAGPLQIPPVTKITCPRERMRAVFYVKDDAVLTDDSKKQLEDSFNAWLEGGVLCLTGIDRMELYELPERTFLEKMIPCHGVDVEWTNLTSSQESPPHLTDQSSAVICEEPE